MLVVENIGKSILIQQTFKFQSFIISHMIWVKNVRIRKPNTLGEKFVC